MGTDPNGNTSFGYPGAYPGNPNDVNFTGTDRWSGGQGYGFAQSAHGLYGTWYWLRMPTMQESANVNFRAGAPFGSAKYGLVWDDIARDDAALTANDQNNPKWNGYDQMLTFLANPDTPLNADTEGRDLPLIDGKGCNMSGSSGNLPVPFIDYWNNPNVWGQVNGETGDLNYASPTGNDVVYTSDVILTNVLSFNVRAWDSELSDYVDLGSGSLNDSSIAGDNPNNLRVGRNRCGRFHINEQYAMRLRHMVGTISEEPLRVRLLQQYERCEFFQLNDGYRQYARDQLFATSRLPAPV